MMQRTAFGNSLGGSASPTRAFGTLLTASRNSGPAFGSSGSATSLPAPQQSLPAPTPSAPPVGGGAPLQGVSPVNDGGWFPRQTGPGGMPAPGSMMGRPFGGGGFMQRLGVNPAGRTMPTQSRSIYSERHPMMGSLARQGRDGDTMLAHINPREAGVLRGMGGRGTVNPRTGLREFAMDSASSRGESRGGNGAVGRDGRGDIGERGGSRGGTGSGGRAGAVGKAGVGGGFSLGGRAAQDRAAAETARRSGALASSAQPGSYAKAGLDKSLGRAKAKGGTAARVGGIIGAGLGLVAGGPLGAIGGYKAGRWAGSKVGGFGGFAGLGDPGRSSGDRLGPRGDSARGGADKGLRDMFDSVVGGGNGGGGGGSGGGAGGSSSDFNVHIPGPGDYNFAPGQFGGNYQPINAPASPPFAGGMFNGVAPQPLLPMPMR